VTEDQEIGRGKYNIVLGAYGDGDKPIIRWTGPNDGQILATDGWNYSTENILVRDLAFETIYEWTTSEVQCLAMQGKGVTVWNCEIEGVEEGVDLRTSIGFYALNCRHGSSRRYQWIVLNSDSAVITGCASGTSDDEHIVRMFPSGNDNDQPNYHININWCDLDYEAHTAGKDIIRYQAVHWATTSYCRLRQGVIAFGHHDGDTDFVIHQSNLYESTPQSNGMVFKPNAHHIMIRNNVFEMSHRYRAAFSMNLPWKGNYGVEHVDIYNNTVICRPGVGFTYGPQFDLRHIEIPVHDVHVANNLLVGGPELRGEENYRINESPSSYNFRKNVLSIDPGNQDWSRIGGPVMPFSEWIKEPFVFGELQVSIEPRDVSAPHYRFPGGYPDAESYCEIMPGLFDDFNGIPYHFSEPIAPGAAQNN